MEAYTTFLLVVLAGGVTRVVVPYLLKVYFNPDIKFDMVYFYNLLVAMVLSVVTLIPNGGSTDLQALVTLFLAALGMTDITNRTVKSIRALKV